MTKQAWKINCQSIIKMILAWFFILIRHLFTFQQLQLISNLRIKNCYGVLFYNYCIESKYLQITANIPIVSFFYTICMLCTNVLVIAGPCSSKWKFRRSKNEVKNENSCEILDRLKNDEKKNGKKENITQPIENIVETNRRKKAWNITKQLETCVT